MPEILEIGTISSRGQISIPSDIRKSMDLKEGQRVLFFLEDDTLLVKKVTTQTFSDITKPLRDAAEKASMKEEDVPGMIQRFRAKKGK